VVRLITPSIDILAPRRGDNGCRSCSSTSSYCCCADAVSASSRLGSRRERRRSRPPWLSGLLRARRQREGPIPHGAAPSKGACLCGRRASSSLRSRNSRKKAWAQDCTRPFRSGPVHAEHLGPDEHEDGREVGRAGEQGARGDGALVSSMKIESCVLEYEREVDGLGAQVAERAKSSRAR